MLSTFELVIYGFLALALFPIIVWSLLTGSRPPPGSIGKYYVAEPYLNFTGNLMVLALCLSAMEKLGQHFGYIGPDLGTLLTGWIGVPLAVLVLAYIVLWIRAILKVRRSSTSA